MKRKIFIPLLLMAFLLSAITAKSQSYFLQAGQTYKDNLTLKTIDGDGMPITAEISLYYDMQAKQLTLCLTPKQGAFDRVWFPMKSYLRESLKSAVKLELNGKLKMMRPFKRSITFGIGPVVYGNGFSIADSPSSGIKQELYKAGESFVTHLNVADPKLPISVKLRGITPIQTMETASGKIKYRFLYTVSDIDLTITLPSDPCKTQQNIQLYNDMKDLYEEINKVYTEMAKANGLREFATCKECKDKFENEYMNRKTELEARYAAASDRCSKVTKMMTEITNVFAEVNLIECKRASVSVDRPRGRAEHTGEASGTTLKIIEEGSKLLVKYTDKINSNIDVKETKKQGREKILELDRRIGSLSDRERNSKHGAEVIKGYESAKRLFERATSRPNGSNVN
jgi:hypothetical protein